MMQRGYTKFGVLLLLANFAQCAIGQDSIERDEKLISTFQIVRFPNDVCVGTNSRNGTCYTSAECSDKGGTTSGSCADGFGVCCTFLVTACGSSSSENITYWTTPTAGITSGAQSNCKLTVCPASDEICSLRVDFTTFVITGPNTISQFQATSRLGAGYYIQYADSTLAELVGGVTFSTNCQYDVFTASGPSTSSNPPEVCGTLTGSHMYIEADRDNCNAMSFSFHDKPQTTVTATNTRGIIALASRSWDMTVTQIECTSPTLPPVGCTQYYWGSGSYVIKNYNYQGNAAVASNQGIHLANQHQRICMRRERGKCFGCFATNAAGFQVSGSMGTALNLAYPGQCCGYLNQPSGGHLNTADEFLKKTGLNGEDNNNVQQSGFDCIIIPGAFVAAVDETHVGTPVATQSATVISTTGLEDNWRTPSGPQICGGGSGIGMGGTTSVHDVIIGSGTIIQQSFAETGGASLTICTTHEPFMLEFMSDDLEGTGQLDDAEEQVEVDSTQLRNRGFSILHSQVDCV